MKKFSVLLVVLSVACLLSLTTGCKEAATTPTAEQTAATPEATATVTPEATATVTPENTPTPTPTPTPEEPYVFPEDGVLDLLTDGKAPAGIDGHNPSLTGDNYTKLLVFFEYTYRKAGLDLAEGTEITYKIKKQDKTILEGTKPLDTSVPEIKNEYGYVGVCIDLGDDVSFGRKEKIVIESLSFKDKSGKEYSISGKTFYKGVSYYGLDSAAFDAHLGDFVETTTANASIKQVGTVNGVEFSFTIGLNLWDGKTKANQIVTISRLFWEVYPRMYARFGSYGESPTKVTLNIENTGYGIASASGNKVHIHDMWLNSNPNDYDCLTHEFAHVIQNGWDGQTLEYSDYIERFADACRYLYAFQNGKYNDGGWELNTISGESTREKSVRFLVWLDYYYSTDEIDVLARYFDVCRNGNYPTSKWATAWAEILRGTKLEGRDIDSIFNEYANSEFAKISSKGVAGNSPLIRKHKDLRSRLK